MIWSAMAQKPWYRRGVTAIMPILGNRINSHSIISYQLNPKFKTKKIAGKQVLFYVTSTNTKSFKRYSVSFPASENRNYSLSVRDTRVFTDNPKVKHCSGPRAFKKTAQVSSFSFYLKNGLPRWGKRKFSRYGEGTDRGHREGSLLLNIPSAVPCKIA